MVNSILHVGVMFLIGWPRAWAERKGRKGIMGGCHERHERHERQVLGAAA